VLCAAIRVPDDNKGIARMPAHCCLAGREEEMIALLQSTSRACQAECTERTPIWENG
jgi:hypothetical protein